MEENKNLAEKLANYCRIDPNLNKYLMANKAAHNTARARIGFRPKPHHLAAFQSAAFGPPETILEKPEDGPVYNDFDKLFAEYQASTGNETLSILRDSDESNGCSQRNLNGTVRTQALQEAMVKLGSMSDDIDVITHRGDIVDLAMCLAAGDSLPNDRIQHIFHKKHGRALFFHDVRRDEPFKKQTSRNSWFSGIKFEIMCTEHCWPEDKSKWGPIALDSSNYRSDKHSQIVALPLGSPGDQQLTALCAAEYDCRDPNIEGPSGYMEVKCMAPFVKKVTSYDWRKMTDAAVLETLVNRLSGSKFLKCCLQSRLVGVLHIVLGIRDRNQQLLTVRRYLVSQIEQQLLRLGRRYSNFYSCLLGAVGQFFREALAACQDGEFYAVTKGSADALIVVRKVEQTDLEFPDPFIPAFEELLKSSCRQRRQYLQRKKTQTPLDSLPRPQGPGEIAFTFTRSKRKRHKQGRKNTGPASREPVAELTTEMRGLSLGQEQQETNSDGKKKKETISAHKSKTS
ncbi:LAMI_0G15258g1_1 [Lachancea mirantina]|uniref:Decapping nuclease n=1 Tax=Lachancea mirantina TaxID=1230905 RepID=A0A1G4KCG5_9SACH|nr:LAMI_0G15258g1_1 [Lachancea mirantina]